MTIEFYDMLGSPPCSIVSLTIAALGIESQIKTHTMEYLAYDHRKPEYIKMNPQHTAPTIVDNGFVLWESRAIARYLINKYGKSSLYPEDIQTRAIVDQRLDFDLGTLYCRYTEYYYPQFAEGKPMDEDNLKKVHEALGFLEAFLKGNKYAAGSALTLADLCLAVTVCVIDITNISLKEYPNIIRWYELVKCEINKFEEIMGKYIKDFKDVIVTLTS